MNVWLTRTALRIRGLSPSSRIVLLAHADACRPSGRTCLVGLDELAAACELSPKHVMRLRAQLVDAGHLRKLAAAHPGRRPVYEVLPAVPIPLPTSDPPDGPNPVAATGRSDGEYRSQPCDPPYKPKGITPPTPQPTPPSGRDVTGNDGAEGVPTTPMTSRPRGHSDSARTPSPETVALAQAAVAALRPDHRTRIDELGLRRLERAAQPLVTGWDPTDLAARIAAERVDRAENLAAVVAAILRRYALEPTPRELHAAERARRAQPPPKPCAHGDPSGCAACSFCRRGLVDPGGERCGHCVPSASSVPSPTVVSA